MVWTAKTVTPPLPPGAQTVVNALSATTGTVGGVLTTFSTLLDAAKIFFNAGTDLFQAIMSTVITEAENLNNDFFGSGGFQLIVDPFGIAGPRFLEDGNGKDQFGIPYLTPGQAISAAIRSFDDAGDANRPQFSSSATVAAFGLMVTAPDPKAFIDVLNALLTVWTLDDLKFVIERTQKRVNGTPPKSVPVDWGSIRFNQIEALAKIQKENNRMLGIARGYLTVGDNVIGEIIDTIQRKVDVLNDSVTAFQEIIDLLILAAGIPNVFVLDVPIGVGGNRKIQEELRDPALEVLGQNKYTMMLLYVGGGPSAVAVDNIRQLVV